MLTEESAVTLKIKESPSRGGYVDGLAEFSIASEEELMCCIERGEAKRVWGATAQNDISSRSHTIFILQIRQVLQDDTEKRGVLNLVDLAGSEKVGRTGAEGKVFEEGTKINLSLSVLGNVIHALTTNADHVPYRGSKLTMLLRESLGGNYKTTLIVTCTPHSSQMADSITSLKFAQRAKKLRNKVRMNIKLSMEQLQKIIEELKEEVARKNEQLKVFVTPRQNYTSPKSMRTTILMVRQTEAAEESANKTKQEILRELGEGTGGERAVNNDELMHELSETKQQLDKLTQENGILKRRITEQDEIIQRLENVLSKERDHASKCEQHTKELELSLEEIRAQRCVSRLREDQENVQYLVMAKQINALTAALEDTEVECFKLLKEKKGKVKKDIFALHNVNLCQYLKKDVPNVAVYLSLLKLLLAQRWHQRRHRRSRHKSHNRLFPSSNRIIPPYPQ